jgi:hypothetical protein
MYKDGYYLNTSGKRVDRFDLEEKIMLAWQTSEDIKLLYNSLEKMNEDQIMGAVDGLAMFAEMRFDDLWNTFEQMLANQRQEMYGHQDS